MTDRCSLAAAAYLWACRRELEVIKPGNVGLQTPGHDMVAEDFLRSAEVSVAPLTDPALSLGQRIYAAIAATRAAVGCNTNLGIVLLAAPLLHAFMTQQRDESLRQSVTRVLSATTRDDATQVFAAITLAAPAGLGSSEQYDVRQQATVTLTAAMAAAQDRDLVAAQYASDFATVFEFGLAQLALHKAEPALAISRLFLALLVNFPDSHIERKFGTALAKEVGRQAEKWLVAMPPGSDQSSCDAVLRQADASLKQRNINPGTSADLTVATLLTQQLLSFASTPVARGDGKNPQAQMSATTNHHSQSKEKHYGY